MSDIAHLRLVALPKRRETTNDRQHQHSYLSSAWRSLNGLKSKSWMMQVSAAVKLIPDIESESGAVSGDAFRSLHMTNNVSIQLTKILLTQSTCFC